MLGQRPYTDDIRIEGMLQSEVAIDGARYDVLRMGLLFSEFAERLGEPGA